MTTDAKTDVPATIKDRLMLTHGNCWILADIGMIAMPSHVYNVWIIPLLKNTLSTSPVNKCGATYRETCRETYRETYRVFFGVVDIPHGAPTHIQTNNADVYFPGDDTQHPAGGEWIQKGAENLPIVKYEEIVRLFWNTFVDSSYPSRYKKEGTPEEEDTQ